VTFAVCPFCEQAMDPGVSCTTVRYDGEDLDRIRYEPDHDGPCHDCNAPVGGLHHPGCDMERCPACGGQAIACECTAGAGDAD
jgi:hypothetical protein